MLPQKLSLLLNICVLVVSVIGAHRAKNAALIYAAYVMAGALTILVAAGFYQFSKIHAPQNGMSMLHRAISDPGLLATMQGKYPTPELLAEAKTQETSLSVWWGAFQLAVFPLLFTALYVFVAFRMSDAGTEAAFQWPALWQFTLVYLVYAVIQGQFLIDPRYTFIDQLYLNRSTNLLVATNLAGMLGLFFGFLLFGVLQKHHIAFGTFMLAICLAFDLILLKTPGTEEGILGQKYIRTAQNNSAPHPR